MGGFAAIEIPLLSLALYLLGKARIELRFSLCGVKRDHSVVARLAPKTVSGREFDWGGTSVKS